MRSKPATRQNSPLRPWIGAALLVLIAAVAAPPAGAQTANSTSGVVGSAASRDGYPATGGAIVLPAQPASGNAGTTAATGAGSGTTTSGGRGVGVVGEWNEWVERLRWWGRWGTNGHRRGGRRRALLGRRRWRRALGAVSACRG
jgi:hypothetical protein